MSTFRPTLLFLALITGLFFLLGMHNYLDLRPQGPHQWRQADCLSFTLNYAEQDNGLFEPELHNLMSDGGQSGKSAGEFPLLYFVVGKIWKTTGQQEWLYRMINLSIFVLGVYALFMILFKETKSLLLSLFLAGMIFTIPVFTFYGPNFLSNITALSLVFIGWYFAHQFYQKQRWRDALLVILFFALAPLLKITALISVLALAGVLGIHFISGRKVFSKPFGSKSWLVSGVGLLVILTITYLWYSFSREYNTLHGGWFTFNDLWPIWQIDGAYFEQTMSFVFAVWMWQYFSPAGYVFLLLSLLLFFVRFKHIAAFSKWMVLFMLLGNVLYIMLWFKALKDHDYYVINLYALPIFLWMIAFLEIKKMVIVNSMTRAFGVIAFVAVLVLNSVYGFQQLELRYKGWFNDNGLNRHYSFFDITPYLRNDLGIERNEKVITFPDPSYCITLYLADQKGWPMKQWDGVDFIKSKIAEGAKYVLVNDSSFYAIEGVESIKWEQIGQHKEVFVLKLKAE